MEYLTQKEVTLIFHHWINRLVRRTDKPTRFICTLCKVPGFGKYLYVCNYLSKPKKIRLIYEFSAQNSVDLPGIEEIRRCVEKEWDFLSGLKKIYYEKELQYIVGQEKSETLVG